MILECLFGSEDMLLESIRRGELQLSMAVDAESKLRDECNEEVQDEVLLPRDFCYNPNLVTDIKQITLDEDEILQPRTNAFDQFNTFNDNDLPPLEHSLPIIPEMSVVGEATPNVLEAAGVELENIMESNTQLQRSRRMFNSKKNKTTHIPTRLIIKHYGDPTWKTMVQKYVEPEPDSFEKDMQEILSKFDALCQFSDISKEVGEDENEAPYDNVPLSLASEAVFGRGEVIRTMLHKQGFWEAEEVSLPLIPLDVPLIIPVSIRDREQSLKGFGGIDNVSHIIPHLGRDEPEVAEQQNIWDRSAVSAELLNKLSNLREASDKTSEDIIGMNQPLQLSSNLRFNQLSDFDVHMKDQTEQIEPPIFDPRLASVNEQLVDLGRFTRIEGVLVLDDELMPIAPMDQEQMMQLINEEPVIPRVLRPRRHRPWLDEGEPPRRRRRRRRLPVEETEGLPVQIPLMMEETVGLPVEGTVEIPLPVDENILVPLPQEKEWAAKEILEFLKNEQGIIRFSDICPRGSSRSTASAVFRLLLEMYVEKSIDIQEDTTGTGNPDKIYISLL
uniref:Uncharacterized protein n=1 Tax=Clastoptera arizonana TaxID=38151 RepID=A0A1B6DG27_9HEMI